MLLSAASAGFLLSDIFGHILPLTPRRTAAEHVPCMAWPPSHRLDALRLVLHVCRHAIFEHSDRCQLAATNTSRLAIAEMAYGDVQIAWRRRRYHRCKMCFRNIALQRPYRKDMRCSFSDTAALLSG